MPARVTARVSSEALERARSDDLDCRARAMSKMPRLAASQIELANDL